MGPPPGGPIATAKHLNHDHAKSPDNDPSAHLQARSARVAGGGGYPVRVKVWGARGSVPTPGPSTNRYGGNAIDAVHHPYAYAARRENSYRAVRAETTSVDG
jgi:hypothetical protein